MRESVWRICTVGKSKLLLELAQEQHLGYVYDPCQPTSMQRFPNQVLQQIRKIEVACSNELNRMDVNITQLVVNDYCCYEEELKALDLGQYVNLKDLRVGNCCFTRTKMLILQGLPALEKVVIGANSFTKAGYNLNKDGMHPYHHFYLKDCKRLKELKIGCKSFSAFTVCLIANVPSLEVIEMGELKQWSCNFNYASLELKSDSDAIK